MRSSKPASNAVGEALRILGDRWTLLVARNMFLEHQRRFGELRATLGIADSVLAARLADMVAAGLLDHDRDYRLTERGLDTWRILVTIWAWERTWVAPEGMPLLVHDACGLPTLPQLACGACRRPTAARDVRTETHGPLELAAPPRHRRRSSKRDPPPGTQTLFADTLAIVGDRWSSVLYASAMMGTRRFVDFQRQLGVSPTLLSGRLRALERAGVLERRQGAGRRLEYRPTDKGVAFFPVIAVLVDWAGRWLGDAGVSFRHAACGAPFRPVLRCAACGETLHRRQLHWTSG